MGMIVFSTAPWKVALAVVLLAGILAGAAARAPQQGLPRTEMRGLVAATLGLYAVGGLAWLTHHVSLAVVLYAAGISLAALAAWFSRGGDADDPPPGEDPVDEQPPPDPDGLRVDWRAFERDLRAYAERARTPSR